MFNNIYLLDNVVIMCRTYDKICFRMKDNGDIHLLSEAVFSSPYGSFSFNNGEVSYDNEYTKGFKELVSHLMKRICHIPHDFKFISDAAYTDSIQIRKNRFYPVFVNSRFEGVSQIEEALFVDDNASMYVFKSYAAGISIMFEVTYQTGFDVLNQDVGMKEAALKSIEKECKKAFLENTFKSTSWEEVSMESIVEMLGDVSSDYFKKVEV